LSFRRGDFLGGLPSASSFRGVFLVGLDVDTPGAVARSASSSREAVFRGLFSASSPFGGVLPVGLGADAAASVVRAASSTGSTRGAFFRLCPSASSSFGVFPIALAWNTSATAD
jgi:hypothetical protein